jgi:hypothetical protein
MAPKAIFRFGAEILGEWWSHFAINPTTRTLKSSIDFSPEARKPVLQQSGGMEVRFYLRRAGLYVRKLVFQIYGALLGMASDLCGKLCDFAGIGHYLSPDDDPPARYEQAAAPYTAPATALNG